MFVTYRSVLFLGWITLGGSVAFHAQPLAAQDVDPAPASEESPRLTPPRQTRWLPPLRLRWVAPVSEAMPVSILDTTTDGRWFAHLENDEPAARRAPWLDRGVAPTRLPCGSEPGGGPDCHGTTAVVLVEFP